MRLLFTIFSFYLLGLTYGQEYNYDKYRGIITEAEQFYSAKDFKKSADKYKEAFDQIEGKAFFKDRYNAACSYALAGDLENSFYHLFRLAENELSNYKDYKQITTDNDLVILHKDERWIKLINIVKANKEEAEKDFDKPLIAMLDTIYREDQTYRKQIGDVEEVYGRDSEELSALWNLINEKDSINLIKIKKILDERGWLGSNIIGKQGNSALFLVIQHSDLETQLKYLPMMQEAVKNGNASAGSLALLEDRLCIKQGKRQIYGSQIGRNSEGGYSVNPIIDPYNVDKRRKEVGLGPIAEYVKIWGIVWDVEKHKEHTKKFEGKK